MVSASSAGVFLIVMVLLFVNLQHNFINSKPMEYNMRSIKGRDLLVKVGESSVSLIVGLSAFFTIKLILMIPFNLIVKSEHGNSISSLEFPLLILCIWLAARYTKNLNSNGTFKSRNIKRIVTVIVGFLCSIMSTVLLVM